jgi:hypothetical protein
MSLEDIWKVAEEKTIDWGLGSASYHGLFSICDA